MIPIELFGGLEKITQRDARGECADEGVAKNLWAQVGQRQELEQSRSCDMIQIRVIAETEFCFHDLIMPAICKSYRIDDMLLGFGDGWEDEVVTIGREDHASAIEFLDLDVEREMDESSSVFDMRFVCAGWTRLAFIFCWRKLIDSQAFDGFGIEPESEFVLRKCNTVDDFSDPVISDFRRLVFEQRVIQIVEYDASCEIVKMIRVDGFDQASFESSFDRLLTSWRTLDLDTRMLAIIEYTHFMLGVPRYGARPWHDDSK